MSACEDFFLLVLEAHICEAAMKTFKMSSLDGEPSAEFFPAGSDLLSPEQRWKVMSLAMKQLIDKFINISYPSASKVKDDDHILAYAKEVMSLGLLLVEFNDGIREGDGERIIRCWRYFLPLFKACGRKNYVVEAFNLLFQYEYLFTPRMKQQLLWDRTINVHGRPGKNVAMDLHMEHINRECKKAMGTLGSNINEDSVRRIGKSIGELIKIKKQFDVENSVPQESGKRSRRSVTADMKKLLSQLSGTKVFDDISGRKHGQFKKFQVNPTRKLTSHKLEKWLKKQVKKYQMFYV